MKRYNIREEVIIFLSNKFNEVLSNINFNSPIKIYPLICGSLAEGLLTIGSDVDFALIVDKVNGKVRELITTFINGTERTLREKYQLKGFCYFSRFTRRVSSLLMKGKNVNFRLNFYIFSIELNTDICNHNDVIHLKMELLRKLGRFYRDCTIKIKALSRATPKTLLKVIQLGVNDLILKWLIRSPDAKDLEVTFMPLEEKISFLFRYNSLHELGESLKEVVELLLELKTIYRKEGKRKCSLKRLEKEGYVSKKECTFILHTITDFLSKRSLLMPS